MSRSYILITQVTCIPPYSTGEAIVEIPHGYQAEWDGGTQLFYTTIDASLRPHSVYVVDVNNIGPNAELVYKSSEDSAVVALARTKDHTHLTINSNVLRNTVK